MGQGLLIAECIGGYCDGLRIKIPEIREYLLVQVQAEQGYVAGGYVKIPKKKEYYSFRNKATVSGGQICYYSKTAPFPEKKRV